MSARLLSMNCLGVAGSKRGGMMEVSEQDKLTLADIIHHHVPVIDSDDEHFLHRAIINFFKRKLDEQEPGS